MYLVVGEALVVVKVDDEDAAGPLERDHLVLLVLPAHVAGVGGQPAVPLLRLVHGRVKVVEMFVPGGIDTERWSQSRDRMIFPLLSSPEVHIVNQVELAASIVVRRVVASPREV